MTHIIWQAKRSQIRWSEGVISHFNGTSTPKGSFCAKTGDNDCNVNSSRYSLKTALCESIRYQAKSEQNVRQDLIPRVRQGEAALIRWKNLPLRYPLGCIRHEFLGVTLILRIPPKRIEKRRGPVFFFSDFLSRTWKWIRSNIEYGLVYLKLREVKLI